MREIKFRAFELDTGCMVYGFYVLEHGYYMINYKPDFNRPTIRHYMFDGCGNKTEIAEDMLMQYTGLKDKNGVEIYEGDILKVASNGYSDYISFRGNNCYVEYNEDGCRFIATTGNGYDTRNAFDLNCDAEIEVIGNIYENPELLEKK